MLILNIEKFQETASALRIAMVGNNSMIQLANR
jgi:hypothetical protein